jgi:L-arabinose isomerase
MDFMNLNQAAHGDREYGFILAKLNIPHEVVAGFYKHDSVIAKIRQFAQVAKAIGLSKKTRVATFGNNMRDVAVTDGNRLECEIKYGWEVKYWGIGEISVLAAKATDEEVDAKMAEYLDKYTMATDNVESVREQARYEVALEKFIEKNKVTAFTDNFQDLHGMKQLPGIAAQNLMAKGVGFGPEGDYKISALSSVLMKMAEGREGATGFIEDYTYDLTPGQELELASHMLEVPASFAANRPEIQVHHLGIGGKEDPARLVFDGVTGDGIQVTLIDLGDHFRIVCADIELVKQPLPMPKLPVARIMYRHKPNFEIGTAAWCYAGGAHHSVVSTALTRSDIAMFARLTGTELITIGDDTTEADLQKFFMR